MSKDRPTALMPADRRSPTPDSKMARDRWPWIAGDARLLKALADETRLGIVLQLREQGEVCQCDFVACCTVAQPTVSHHLRVLREAGLVEGEKRGVWMHYRLNPAALGRLRRYTQPSHAQDIDDQQNARGGPGCPAR